MWNFILESCRVTCVNTCTTQPTNQPTDSPTNDARQLAAAPNATVTILAPSQPAWAAFLRSAARSGVEIGDAAWAALFDYLVAVDAAGGGGAYKAMGGEFLGGVGG